MSVISTLRDILRPPSLVPSPHHEEHLTVAALITLVAHADGRVLPVETEGLRVLLSSRFGLSPAEADRILYEAGKIKAGMDPATTLIDRILHDIPAGERPPLLALAYRIAAIDGKVHDFEDDLIWRTGRLLGFQEPELARIKAEAIRNLVSGQARG